jgi:hypothetical protein
MQSKSRAGKAQNRLSCARRPASRGFSHRRAVAMKRGRCSAAIYGWFTEGFDTADLKDAKALLDELNALTV